MYSPIIFLLGEAARKLFDNLKKRFLKKRLKYRKLKASGMPSDIVSAAKDEMDSYSFLNWLVPHIRMRRTKRDLNNMEISGMMEVKREGTEIYGSDECGSSFDETFDDDGEMENASMVSSTANYVTSTACYTKSVTPVSMVAQPPVTPAVNNDNEFKRKYDGSNNLAPIKSEPAIKRRHTMGFPTRNGVVKLVNRNVNSESPELSVEDETDLFGKMIAAEIKAFSPRDQCIAKHQIHTVLFELKMTNFSQTPTTQWQSPHPVYVVSGSGAPQSHRYTPRSRPPGYTIDSYYPADSSISKDGNE